MSFLKGARWLLDQFEHIQELVPLQGRLSIEHLCQLVAVSRRGFYRSLRQRESAEEETEVRSLIQQIALEHRRYGYRRITAELHRRDGHSTIGTFQNGTSGQRGV